VVQALAVSPAIIIALLLSTFFWFEFLPPILWAASYFSLKDRRLAGWRLFVLGTALSLIGSLLRFNLIGILFSGAILYFTLQVYDEFYRREIETGEPSRFPNTKHALSYCGLCSPQRESSGIGKRGPLSKQRNRFLQTTLVEAAHLAPRYNQALRAIYEVARQKGSANRATPEVARRLVRYLLAVDRQHFQQCAAA